MGYTVVNPVVSKDDDILTVNLTLQLIDNTTNDVIEERNFSAHINWNRTDAKDLLEKELKKKALDIKKEMEEKAKIKTTVDNMVEKIKTSWEE